MSDLKSLKADRNFAGSLLRSAAGDAPSAHARRLAASSLGLGLGMVVTTSVVPSALAAGTTLGTATAQVVVPTGVKAISVLSVSKWLVSSFVVGVVASSSALTVHEVVTSHQTPGLAQHAQPNLSRASKRATGDARPAAAFEPRVPDATARMPDSTARMPDSTAHMPDSAAHMPDSAAHMPDSAARIPTTPAPPSTLPRVRSGTAAANVSEPGTSGPATSSRQIAEPPTVSKPASGRAAFPVAQETDRASLDEEIAWLEPARSWLQAKNGRQALAALDRATPHVRLLASEAALLRVEALLLVGRRAEAERMAEPFLSRYPSSLHAERLRRLLDPS